MSSLSSYGETRGFQPGGGTILQMPCSTHWGSIDMTYCSKFLNSSIVGWKTGHSRSPLRAPSAMLEEVLPLRTSTPLPS
jgi:hypothetical protein